VIKPIRLLLPCLILAGCQALPYGQPDALRAWAGYAQSVDGMDSAALASAQDAALESYEANPSDQNRLRAAYVLSHKGAGAAQLKRSREILAEIPKDSELAPLADLLDRSIRYSQEAAASAARERKSAAERDRLQKELAEVREQLEALKNIEQDIVKSQQKADDLAQ
jgi:hypothetical protein